MKEGKLKSEEREKCFLIIQVFYKVERKKNLLNRN